MNELEKRAKHHKKFQKGCLFPFGSAQGCAESLTGSADESHGGDGDSSNNSLSEARKNLITKGSKMLSEAVERGVKVYEVEKDGPPDVGRQIIAFVDSHEEYTILTRQDKDIINKKSWDDKEGHKSADGEYYAGKNGWIYALGYSKYIYLDELDLIPQKHFDKVAREIEAGNKQKVDLEQKLARIYGDELASKIAPEVISVTRGGRRVELPHYYSYLLAMPKHRDALKGLEGALLRHIDKDTVKQVMAKTPGVVNNYPGSEQYKLSEDLEMHMLERWSDDALDELSKKPKDEWTEADWDTYNYCKNANAERDYYDSLDESSSQDYYNYITKMKTSDSDNKLVNSEESIEDFVKRVTSRNDSIQYVADKIEKFDDKYYLVGFKKDMSRIEFLLGTPGEDASERNVKHILKNPYWHISLSLKDELSSKYLSNSINEAKKKNKGVYLNKDAGNVEHNVAAFNHAMSASEGPSTNPCGPMADGFSESLKEQKKEIVEGLRLRNGMTEDESLYFDEGNYSYHFFHKNNFFTKMLECAVLVIDYGFRFHYDRSYVDDNGHKVIPTDMIHEKPQQVAYFEFNELTQPSIVEAMLDDNIQLFRELIKAEAAKHTQVSESLVESDVKKYKDYEYIKVSVPSPSGKETCNFGVHKHNDGHCSISGVHPYDDGDYHWANSKDGITFNIYVGNPGKLVKKFVSDHDGYEDICSELAKLDKNVKSVMVHW